MPVNLILFDMDGVLLEPGGYHAALRATVQRIGRALGVPNTNITADQIARFEALNITNEWDSVAICAALTLVHTWQYDGSIRLDGFQPRSQTVTNEPPDFDEFLMILPDGGHLPGQTTYDYLQKQHRWLDPNQLAHLAAILENCRDIYTSPTLPIHQETVLGSRAFFNHYKLEPQLDTESYLLKYDRPIMTADQHRAFRDWLSDPDHFAGILTNRPSRTPPGYLSAPEAELGVELIGMGDLPWIGSGILGWFAASHHSNLPDHSLLKPNPVHALSLMQHCLGRSQTEALRLAVSLWQGEGDFADWQVLDGAKIVVFEDSMKGLVSGRAACSLLNKMGLETSLTLIGVGKNPIKLAALEELSTRMIANINEINWNAIFS